MKYSDFKEKTKKWNHFNQVDTLGSFDFLTLTVCLDSLNEHDITEYHNAVKEWSKDEKIPTDIYQKLSKVIPLAIHEYTHFLDSTSTLWGLNYLTSLNEAYLSDERRGGTEETFFKAKNFLDKVKGIRLPNYYTFIDKKPRNQLPWQWKTSIGRVFSSTGKISERPVLFTTFANSGQELLARSPISTISILEASAMSQEVLLQLSLIAGTPKDFCIVEQHRFISSISDHLHNREITEYSVCVHLIANTLKCSDIGAAFTLCALLTKVVLNFPKAMLDLVLECALIHEIFGLEKGTDFELAIRDGIKHHDLGIIFFILCNALPMGCDKNIESMTNGIQIALNFLGIKTHEYKKSIQEEAESLAGNLVLSQVYPIPRIASAGLNNLKSFDIFTPMIEIDKAHIPQALLGDSETKIIFSSLKNGLLDMNVDTCFSNLFEGQQWVERFSEACL